MRADHEEAADMREGVVKVPQAQRMSDRFLNGWVVVRVHGGTL